MLLLFSLFSLFSHFSFSLLSHLSILKDNFLRFDHWSYPFGKITQPEDISGPCRFSRWGFVNQLGETWPTLRMYFEAPGFYARAGEIRHVKRLAVTPLETMKRKLLKPEPVHFKAT
ncbi:hypothetical protein N7517_000617 [Penicillium concentricum]|uniref:Uncharacterized protein n=1 Tax=Penicillium concentricum TaxID=293559 RepID=A0A9W9VKH0_9EURO|nr:uncharacterized protein N7517_000617 [Penicillium concentricum]KAJ5382706.1 hypothetical protein N7517_000617 [Penicillium concentricum]